MAKAKRGRRKRLKKKFSFIPWKFLLIHFALPVSDIVTDTLTGYNYHKRGHVRWARSIWLLMLGPLCLALCSESIRLIGKWVQSALSKPRSRDENVESGEQDDHADQDNKEDTVMNWKKGSMIKENILKFAALVPLFQPFVHLYFAYRLREAVMGMEEAKDEYKNVEENVIGGVQKLKQNDITKMRSLVHSAAQKYHRSKIDHGRIVTIFQGIRLYEIIGESGPQAVLQMSIAFRIGYIGFTQVLGVAISILSLASGAAQSLFLNQTKRNAIKHESWKHTWLIFVPIMIALTVPRLLSLALLTAYTKGYAILFISLFAVVSILISLYPYIMRDPADAFVGVMTNLFSPCMVIEEGSKFLPKSSIVATLLHCLNLTILVSLIKTESAFVPSKEENPPLIHCFGNNNYTNSTFSRCLPYGSRQNNCQDGLTYSNDTLSYATYCNHMEQWVPLVTVSATLVAFLLLSIP